MMSGSSGIDLALLVIAADDSIMPQTREHLEILQLLNVKSGLIIINKIDLVDSDILELVELEINDFTKDTFLENAKIFKTSIETNEGIEELNKEVLNINKSKSFDF